MAKEPVKLLSLAIGTSENFNHLEGGASYWDACPTIHSFASMYNKVDFRILRKESPEYF